MVQVTNLRKRDDSDRLLINSRSPEVDPPLLTEVNKAPTILSRENPVISRLGRAVAVRGPRQGWAISAPLHFFACLAITRSFILS